MTSYYVDPQGSDVADGRSPGTAWKTLDRVKNVALMPRDSVLFRRGGTWSGRGRLLSLYLSGMPDGLITFGAYGIGNRPLFLLDPNFAAGEQQGFVISGSYAALNSLRVSLTHPFRSPTGKEPDNQNVKLGWYLGFNISGQGIVVNDCEADHLAVGINLTDTSLNCRVFGNYNHHLDTFWRVDGAAGAMGAIAIQVHGDDHEIAYNRSDHTWAECVRTADGSTQTYGAPFEVYNCNRSWFHHNKALPAPDDLGFRKSFETGFGTGFTCDDNTIEDNIFISNRPNARGPNIHGPAAFGPCRRNILRRNTIKLTGTLSESMIIGTDSVGNQVYDNILQATAKAIFLGSGGGSEHHNLFWGGQVQIQNGTMSATSKKQDPMLDMNYNPLPGSPAIGMASDGGTVGARLSIGETLVSILQDLRDQEAYLRVQANLARSEADSLGAQATIKEAEVVTLRTQKDAKVNKAAELSAQADKMLAVIAATQSVDDQLVG